MLKEENIEYHKLNGKRGKYNLYEVNGTKVTADMSEPLFTERYRPRRIFDLIVTNEVQNELNSYVKNKSLPHLLLYSQKGGTGKTTISGVMINEFNSDFLSIPMNIDRGMEIIRTKAVSFSQNLSMFGDFKILSIEEIGDATSTAIDSFKSIIDVYGKNVRLILTTNSMAKISQPLKTRFKVYDFNKIPESSYNEVYEKIYNRLKAILEIEGIEYTDNDIAVIMKKYGFSYRELINALESSIKDKKLDISSLISNSKSSLSDILNLINNKDIMTLASTTENVNHMTILEELSENYLELIEDSMMIQPFIMYINDCQKDIIGVAFPSITFLDFCFKLIKDGVRFKVN